MGVRKYAGKMSELHLFLNENHDKVMSFSDVANEVGREGFTYLLNHGYLYPHEPLVQRDESGTTLYKVFSPEVHGVEEESDEELQAAKVLMDLGFSDAQITDAIAGYGAESILRPEDDFLQNLKQEYKIAAVIQKKVGDPCERCGNPIEEGGPFLNPISGIAELCNEQCVQDAIDTANQDFGSDNECELTIEYLSRQSSSSAWVASVLSLAEAKGVVHTDNTSGREAQIIFEGRREDLDSFGAAVAAIEPAGIYLRHFVTDPHDGEKEAAMTPEEDVEIVKLFPTHPTDGFYRMVLDAIQVDDRGLEGDALAQHAINSVVGCKNEEDLDVLVTILEEINQHGRINELPAWSVDAYTVENDKRSSWVTAVEKIKMTPELIQYMEEQDRGVWAQVKTKHPNLPALPRLLDRPFILGLRDWARYVSADERLAIVRDLEQAYKEYDQNLLNEAKASKNIAVQNRLMDRRFIMRNRAVQLGNLASQILSTKAMNEFMGSPEGQQIQKDLNDAMSIVKDFGKRQGAKKLKYETFEAFEDGDGFCMDLNSAFDLWMGEKQKREMFKLYTNGAKFVSKILDFDQDDKDKFRAAVAKQEKAMKARGFEEFASEDNIDQAEFIYVKKAGKEAATEYQDAGMPTTGLRSRFDYGEPGSKENPKEAAKPRKPTPGTVDFYMDQVEEEINLLGEEIDGDLSDTIWQIMSDLDVPKQFRDAIAANYGVVSGRYHSAAPLPDDMHPDIKNFKNSPMFNFKAPENMEANVGKYCIELDALPLLEARGASAASILSRARSQKIPYARLDVFEIVSVQKIYDGSLAYRVVSPLHDQARFGFPLRPSEIEIVSDSNKIRTYRDIAYRVHAFYMKEKSLGAPTQDPRYPASVPEPPPEEINNSDKNLLKSMGIQGKHQRARQIRAINLTMPGTCLEHFRPDLQGELVDAPESQHPVDDIRPPHHDDGNMTLERGAKGMSGVSPMEQIEGVPMRRELNLHGPSFTDNFYKAQDNLSPSAFHASKKADGETPETPAMQFLTVLKQVLGTFTASCIGMFQNSQRPIPFDGQAGEHKVNLGEFASASTYDPSGKFNVTDLAVSRIQGIADALKADEVRIALDSAWAQAAVWCDGENGFLYEVYASGYSFDPKTLDFVFKYITGKKGDLKLAKAAGRMKKASMGDISPAEWAQMTYDGSTRDSVKRGGEGPAAFCAAAQSKEYEAETKKINEAKKTDAAKASHKFQAAKWTLPNGHPRCLICGDEETTDGMCKGAKVAAETPELPPAVGDPIWVLGVEGDIVKGTLVDLTPHKHSVVVNLPSAGNVSVSTTNGDANRTEELAQRESDRRRQRKQGADIAPTYRNQEPKDPREDKFDVLAPLYNVDGEEIGKIALSGYTWSEPEANGRAFHYEFDTRTQDELKKLTREQITSIEDIVEDLIKGADEPKTGSIGSHVGSYTEFDQSYAVPDDIPTSFVDDTWTHDTCPSFISEAGDQKLWIEHPDPLQREDPDPSMKRFTLTDADDRSKVIFESDDWDQVKQHLLAPKVAKRSPDAGPNAFEKPMSEVAMAGIRTIKALMKSKGYAAKLRKASASYEIKFVKEGENASAPGTVSYAIDGWHGDGRYGNVATIFTLYSEQWPQTPHALASIPERSPEEFLDPTEATIDKERALLAKILSILKTI